MFILNTPIPVKNILPTLSDWIKCLKLNRDELPLENRQLRFVYFSYNPDFNYLKLSIKSLINSGLSPYVGSVTVFEDQSAPFEQSQRDELTALLDSVEVKPVDHIDWASKESTFNEISSFRQVLEDANHDDLLIKVDSDILFLPSKKLVGLLFSNIQACGDGHSEGYKFMQGGLYCMRANLAENIFKSITLDEVCAISDELKTDAEDRIITRIFARLSDVTFTRLMLFPSEYQQMRKLSAFNLWDFQAAHFVKDKDMMQTKYTQWFDSKD